MKLIHLGDLHLGKKLEEFDLIDDQRYILNRILDVIDREQVDGVLIAGDVYDTKMPSEAAMNLLDWFLSSLSERNVATFMISGNHDSDDRLNYGSWTFEKQGIYISSIYEGKIPHHTFKADGVEADIYMMPFIKMSHVRHYYPDENIGSYSDAVRVAIDKTDIDESRCNIIIAHQFVAGNDSDPVMGGSESMGTLRVGDVEKVGCDCFDKFDYVALGHIHSPQHIGRKLCRYAGSPLKYSYREVSDKKTFPLITIGGKGDIRYDLIDLEPKREVRPERGKLKEILDKARIHDTDDYIYAILTDEDPIVNAIGILRQVYPNTIKLTYDNSRIRDVEHVDISDIAQGKTFTELIEGFYKLMYGEDEVPAKEMEILRQAAREAGVIDEAD